MSRSGLDRIRSDLSERDLAVLTAVKQHRFLTGRQIQRLSFEEHRSGETAARICRGNLQRLTERSLLMRLRRRVGGRRAGSASYVYALGPAGQRLLHDGPERKRTKEPSALFLEHTLAIAETHIGLLDADRHGVLELVDVAVEPACWRRYAGIGGGLETLRPDLYVVTAAGEFEDCWFLEVDLATESLPSIAAKCRAYESYRRAGREQERHGVFPLVVWVAPESGRANRIGQAISTARDLTHDIFRVTTGEELVGLLREGAE